MTVFRPPGKQPGATPAPPPVVISTGQVPFAPGAQSGGGIPIMAGQFIPPNGFAGFAQQTAAVQSLFRGKGRNGGSRKRRRKSTMKASPKRKKRSSSKKKARLVKGSAAAKKYMASIRRKRK